MTKQQSNQDLAVWALTENGRALGLRILGHAGGGDLFLSASVADPPASARAFTSLAPQVAESFRQYRSHVFIMAAGIAVRVTAPLLGRKSEDPAVVVLDDAGRFSISLLSGHLGGANDLARSVAGWTGALPVITTATDAHGLPGVDVLARDRGLFMENPEAVKWVSRSLLEGKPVPLLDPLGFFRDAPPEHFRRAETQDGLDGDAPCVAVSDEAGPFGPRTLVLRPRSLCVGMGCRKGVPGEELKEFLETVFNARGLSVRSILCLATADIKAEEPGMLWLAGRLNANLRLFTSRELAQVENVPTPSLMVERYLGASSVCEAAAMKAANAKKCLITKTKSGKATLAVARLACPW
ncbi:MAG: cobalamin biosynthesis protein [Thermodesulfobacteriota bacterium]